MPSAKSQALLRATANQQKRHLLDQQLACRRDCANIADITETEIDTRNTIREVLDYLREACPIGLRNAYLYDIAPQLGSRCSYRLQGEHIMTPRDFAFAPQFDDVIAWHSTICMINDCGPIEIPYRSILPHS